MAYARARFGSLSFLLIPAACLSASIAQAEPAPPKPMPMLVSGSGKSASGLFTSAASGAVFELPNHALLRVAPNSTLRVFPTPQTLQVTPGPSTTMWSFSIQNGRVDVDMAGVAHDAVVADLGKLNAVVTKGRVAVLASPSEHSVANTEGEVRTRVSARWQNVPVGSIATLSRANPTATAKPGVPAPTLDGGRRLFMSLSDSAAMNGFHWANVSGANRYELRLRRLADGKVIEQRSTPQTESGALTPVVPGRYGLALRAVDARGVEGGWSPESELRVIGVVLPPGSYSSDEAIYLGDGQQVHFTNTAGLEMTFGADRYIPASSSASLHRNAATLVGFRLPGGGDSATMRLEPRKIYAEVHLGPTSAVWPRDPISIDIRLRSASGGKVPSFLQVLPKVTVDLEPISPTFERNGDTLHAVVRPTRNHGPWVLRVDVADQFGVELGHEFMEVAVQSRQHDPAVRVMKAPKAVVDAQPPPLPPNTDRAAIQPVFADAH